MIIVMLRIAGDFALGSPLRGSLPALPSLVNNIIIQNYQFEVLRCFFVCLDVPSRFGGWFLVASTSQTKG